MIDAANELYRIGIKIQASGSGAAILSQNIVPGTYVNKGSTVICYFDDSYFVGPSVQ